MRTKRNKSSYKDWKKYGCQLCDDFEHNNNECPYEQCIYNQELSKYENYKSYEKDCKVDDIEVLLGLKKRKGKRV